MIGSSVNSIVYKGNGKATEFAYPFAIIDKSDIHVTLVSPENVETELTKDYFVDATKNVVLYPGYAPGTSQPESDKPPVLPTDWRLIIYREVPITQEVALDEHWPFDNIEDGLDKLTIICQQLFGESNRSLKLSRLVDMSTVDDVLPFEPGKTIRMTEDGKGFEATEDPAKALVLTNADKEACAASALAAASSESNAASSEASASSSASTATQKAAVATQKATEAGGYADAAADSASTASSSKTAAAASASAASSSETNALASQQSATASADAAATSANNASGSASSAALSAAAAAESAGAASTAAQNAAVNAADNVSDLLSGKVTAAQTAANNAEEYKNAAAVFASNAEDSAAAAAASAGECETAVNILKGVKTVNGVGPDSNGNIAVDVGAKTVNGNTPDSAGNVAVDVGVTSVNGQTGNVTIDNFVKSGSGAKAGLVPAPSTTAGTAKYLREDCTWETPPNTTYNVVTQSTDGLMSSTDKTRLDGCYVVASSLDSNSNGYIRYSNGLQICWGSMAWEARLNADDPTATFPVAFSSAPIVNLSPLAIDQRTKCNAFGIFSLTASNFKFNIYGLGSNDKNTGMHYIAIGTWK